MPGDNDLILRILKLIFVTKVFTSFKYRERRRSKFPQHNNIKRSDNRIVLALAVRPVERFPKRCY